MIEIKVLWLKWKRWYANYRTNKDEILRTKFNWAEARKNVKDSLAYERFRDWLEHKVFENFENARKASYEQKARFDYWSGRMDEVTEILTQIEDVEGFLKKFEKEIKRLKGEG